MSSIEHLPDAAGLMLPRGTRLNGGRVVVEDVLGNGGFGITYSAKHSDYGKVALKEFMPRSMVFGRRGKVISVLQEKSALYTKCREQFEREARILSTLSHPNIVRVLDRFEDNDTAYYCMELLDGSDLGTFMDVRGTPLDPAEAYALMLPVIDAMIYLHSQKVLHRDISPDNIILRPAPAGLSPCLIDFGAAFSAQKDFTHTFPRVKKSGYSPIEQTWDEQYQGTWSDVYSICATIYYAMTFTMPVPAAERGVGSNDAMKRPREINPNIPPAVDEVLMRGLALDYKQRIPQMAQLRQALVRAFGYEPGQPERPAGESEGARPDVGAPEGGPGKPGAMRSDSAFRSEGATRSGGAMRALGALLLDWLICWVMPGAILSLAISPAVGIAVGAGISIVVNGLLAAFGGTLGQRLLECGCVVRGVPGGLLYSLLRHIVPLALADGLLAMRSNEHFIDRLFADRPPEEARSVQSAPEPPRLKCVAGLMRGESFDLRGSVLIGRSPEANIGFPEDYKTISRHHCGLSAEPDGWHVTDLHSRNGTALNGQRLTAHVPSPVLKHGDKVSVGSEVFIYEEGGTKAPTNRR